MNAPVVVFAYNRPDHLAKTLSALSQNNRAKESDVFIFIDGPKQSEGIMKQKQVIEVANRFLNSFKSVSVTASEVNKGLAKSIISGVTKVLDKYGRVIVVEDDAVSSENYLDFMNGALDYYEKDPSVWSIGGFTVPMKLPDDYQYDIIKTQRVSSYAWAIWKNRWDTIDWKVSDYCSFKFDFIGRHRFNRWGNDRSSMFDEQMHGKVDSWAIRFDYAMFRNNMYNIVPRQSLIMNTGHDGSGTHSKTASEIDEFKVELTEASRSFVFTSLDTDERIRKEFCKPFFCGVGFRLKHYFTYAIRLKK